ncbi:hypothetical protein MXD62_35925 [Frankia sp. Mgl5]|uniref:hypothetical protein n=1 Tax=Frankia sp. Mgl5 TaxID=2933793 RepID=UPI00200E06D9|nr:hypothetical protein [Frankia sp. Mgl5]MCK9932468.1 hypothetical protein [Frankia sp. Mgl5]
MVGVGGRQVERPSAISRSTSCSRGVSRSSGSTLTLARPDTLSLAPWAGFGLLCGYVAVLLALAARRLRRRDT